MKNPTFVILKGLAIVLVVMSHAGFPAAWANFIFQFHVPAFFICAGYFFNTAYLNDEKIFLKHRVKGLYIPFLKYALFFLVAHNLFYWIGIVNQSAGNGGGLTASWYTWHNFCQRLWNIVLNMSGYDEFLAGSFWFFRALFVGGIAYLVGFKLLRKVRVLRQNDLFINACLAIGALALAAWKIDEHIKFVLFAPGGYREIMAVFFIAIGFMYRRAYEWMSSKPIVCIIVAVLATVVAILFSKFMAASMAFSPTLAQHFALPVPAVCGFIMLHALSVLIATHTVWVRRAFVYIGERTLLIFAFHLLAFKAVSVFKVVCYGLPWTMVGGHPVVHHEVGDGFCWLYLLCGVGLPLVVVYYFRVVRAAYRLTPRKCLRLASHALIWVFAALWKAVCIVFRAVKSQIVGFFKGMKDILSAAHPGED